MKSFITLSVVKPMETMFYLWKRFKVSEFPKKVFSKLEPVVLAMGFGILHFGEFLG
jgi:hypothetical protein